MTVNLNSTRRNLPSLGGRIHLVLLYSAFCLQSRASFKKIFFNWLLERERVTSNLTSPYLCIHWLILVCALTGDQTHNLGILGQHSNQLSYPDKAKSFLICIHTEIKIEGTPVCHFGCELYLWQSSLILRSRLLGPGPHFPFPLPFDIKELRLEAAASLAPIHSAWNTPSADPWTGPVVDDAEVYAPIELVRLIPLSPAPWQVLHHVLNVPGVE